MTFGLPPLASVMMLAQAWAMPEAFPYVAGLPILSLLLAYVYFPVAAASRGFFNRHNALKSVLLGLVLFEVYRQLLVSVVKASGTSAGALIQQHCGSDVEALQAAMACGAVVSTTLLVSNLLLWFVPAALVYSISRSRLPGQLERSEAS
jgi:hypothetical protein